ncbi:MAG: D-alanyl-D-alanine dipeptidase [Rubrivivax sp.]|nr:D-alanyl-D-alanine dipeptidase [Rubrivivax sp.]
MNAVDGVAALPVEALPGHPDFVRLADIPGIAVDLRYAGTDNFAGRNLYGAMDCAWLRREAAEGLAAAAAWLSRQAPGWTLRVLDALRPQRVQEAIWAGVVGTPQQLYFANPVRGSIHSFGMAVDATLLDAAGREVDMGSGFDEMDLASHPALHDQLLASGRLSPVQVQRRQLLHDAMAAGGFAGIPTEWWHFDHGDRERVRRELPRVL